MELNLILADCPKEENVCTIRLTTSYWSDRNGVYTKKSLKFLKRKSKGYNILQEDCLDIGASEVIPSIINFDSVEDGVYEVIICNKSRDWETGDIDSYEYKLVPVID